MCSWADKPCPHGWFEKTCFAMWSSITLKELNWPLLLELWESDKTWLHHCFSGQWRGWAEQTHESVCVVLWSVSGMVCLKALALYARQSSWKSCIRNSMSTMHLYFPVCLYERMSWWNWFYTWSNLIHFLRIIFIFIYCYLFIVHTWSENTIQCKTLRANVKFDV